MIWPLLAAALAAEAPALSTSAEVHVLDNGLTVILEESHRTDTVALHIKYGIGSRDEVDGEHGCAHLFEHLMFEGSANVPTNAFDTWLTAAGGSNNAWTSEDETAYHMTFPSGALDLALFLESDRLGFLDAGLTEENLTNQQSVVLQERNQGYAEPHGGDWDALVQLLYPADHPYHIATIGTVADVEGFQTEAVNDFWRRHYRPKNAVLALVGHFDSAEALERVTHWFSDVPDTGEALPRVERPAEPSFAPTHGVIHDEVEDRTVYLAWPGAPLGSKDEASLDLLSWVLDGGRGTPFADKMYYRGNLTTNAGLTSWGSEIDGAIVAYATSPHASLKKLTRKMEAILRRAAKKEVDASALERARTAVLGGILDSMEDPVSRATAFADCYAQTGDANCLQASWDRYVAATPADLADVARRYIRDDRRVTLSVVPKDDTGALPGAIEVVLP